jgi:peroxin-6
MDPHCDLLKVAEKCPFHLTGADFYALCTDAMMKSVSRVIEKIDQDLKEWNHSGPHDVHPHPTSETYYLDHIAEPQDIEVVVQMQDFMDALEDLKPSVSPQELERYKKIRDQFEPERKDKKGKGKLE